MSPVYLNDAKGSTQYSGANGVQKGDDKRNGAKDSTRYPEANEVQKATVYIEKRQYP
jgi:hypothetical protein